MKSEHLSFLALVCLLVAATLGFGVYLYDYNRAIFQLPLAVGAAILALCAAEAGRVSGMVSTPTAGP
ncbi:MAG TPA: hypothetical protein VJJ77_02180, partial [Dongiaceae bacterium]|nr:hypothetical protein [Dongiaceae bacterium]